MSEEIVRVYKHETVSRLFRVRPDRLRADGSLVDAPKVEASLHRYAQRVVRRSGGVLVRRARMSSWRDIYTGQPLVQWDIRLVKDVAPEDREHLRCWFESKENQSE